jgi:ABC-type dipeptide/oligopeptide/nickel transport system ATPase component
MLTKVGLPDVQRMLAAYPHQLSGGQRQRVMIAMALSCSPRLLIADEPTTALDVTIQAQILRLLRDLQEQFNFSVILITHNLGVVAQTCDRLAVLYAGRVAEIGTTESIFNDPQHPTRSDECHSAPGFPRQKNGGDSRYGTVKPRRTGGLSVRSALRVCL